MNCGADLVVNKTNGHFEHVHEAKIATRKEKHYHYIAHL